MEGKLIIFSAPSGSGKSTIINYLMQQNLNLAFSISATSRPPRGSEQHGVEYFFLSPEEFRQRIANDEFLEYEEVYKDRFYGTLKDLCSVLQVYPEPRSEGECLSNIREFLRGCGASLRLEVRPGRGGRGGARGRRPGARAVSGRGRAPRFALREGERGSGGSRGR